MTTGKLKILNKEICKMSNTVNILDFGAVANSDKLQSDKIQAAIDHCFTNGGGEVVVPEGVYLIGDIRLRSNITLHLMKNAVLKGSVNPDDYFNICNDKIEPFENVERVPWLPATQRTPEYSHKLLYTEASFWKCGMIRILDAENVSVIGEEGSVIDGSNCYNPNGEEMFRGPHGFSIARCKNLYFTGYTIIRTGNWAHCTMESRDIKVENITVLAGHDGVHFRGCDNVLVRNCTIKSGDDSVAGFDNRNVHVHNCYLSSACNVFRFGGRDVLIEDCEVVGPCEYPFRGSLTPEEKAQRVEDSKTARRNALTFYTYFVDHSRKLRFTAGNILVRNCTVTNVDRMFRLNLSGAEPWQKGTPPEDITFENITVKGTVKAANAYGNDELPFKLTMKNIDYTLKDGFEEKSFINLGKYGEIVFEDVTIHNFKGNELIKTWGDKDKIILKNFVCDGVDNDNFVVEAEDEFDLKYI